MEMGTYRSRVAVDVCNLMEESGNVVLDLLLTKGKLVLGSNAASRDVNDLALNLGATKPHLEEWNASRYPTCKRSAHHLELLVSIILLGLST